MILCGLSDGGTVFSGMAGRLPARFLARVYLDAFVPEHALLLNALMCGWTGPRRWQPS